MRFVFLGLPGAGMDGRGPRAGLERLPLAAAVVRDQLQAGPGLEDGEAAGQEVVPELHGVDERLGEPDASKGFILDGFPRTVRQAQALEVALVELGTPLTAVVKFTISDTTAIRRIIGRYTCPVCKRTYHQEWKPPANDLVCDVDGTPLEKRSDEDELTVKRRLAIYREQTEPLERYYAERGLLREVDAEARMDTVTERMLAALGDAV